MRSILCCEAYDRQVVLGLTQCSYRQCGERSAMLPLVSYFTQAATLTLVEYLDVHVCFSKGLCAFKHRQKAQLVPLELLE